MSKRLRSPKTKETVKRRPKRPNVFVQRPFAGLATESEWVALRELIPAASSPVRLVDPAFADRSVVVTTVLPMASAAMVKPDGRIFLSLQTVARSGDLSRDLASILEKALTASPGTYVGAVGLPDSGPRLQDLLAEAGKLNVELYETFDYWFDDPSNQDSQIAESLQQANAAILPTVGMPGVDSAYWCQVADRAHMRWVLPEEEDLSLRALARLSAIGELSLGDGTRFAGSFRAHGLLIPVWDLPRDAEALSWRESLSRVAKAYEEALLVTEPLTSAERRALEAIRGRQITLR